MTAVKAVVN